MLGAILAAVWAFVRMDRCRAGHGTSPGRVDVRAVRRPDNAALIARFSSGLGEMVYVSVACLITLLSVTLINEQPECGVGTATDRVSVMT